LKNGKRPKLRIPLSLEEKMLIIIATLTIIAMWLYLWNMWDEIPNIVPTHFGFSGAPDRFGSKSSLFALPIISSIMHILLVVLSKMPQYFNYPVKVTEKSAAALYKIGKQLILLMDMEIALMFLMLMWESIQTAIGSISGLGIEIVGIFMFIILGTVIYETIRMIKFKS